MEPIFEDGHEVTGLGGLGNRKPDAIRSRTIIPGDPPKKMEVGELIPSWGSGPGCASAWATVLFDFSLKGRIPGSTGTTRLEISSITQRSMNGTFYSYSDH